MSQTFEKLIVSKFGGSSMADKEAITRSATVAVNRGSSVVLVSATYGTTNQIIEMTDHAKLGNWDEAKNVLDKLAKRHLELAQEFELNDKELSSIKEILTEASTLVQGVSLLKDCNKKVMDSLLSIGERISSHYMRRAIANVLAQKNINKNVTYFDISKVMITDDRFGSALPQLELIKKEASKYMMDAKHGEAIFVSQGFVGSTKDGQTTTLGRGGSDYSAALIAEAIGANELEIWTDVAGIATTDPRICPKARPINQITFQEAAELATFGAKILHPTTLAPALRSNIPVFVGSSYEPEKEGTWIKKECEHRPLVRAMALRKNQSLLTITTPKMLHAHGFLARIFGLFDQYKISVDAITTSEISVAMTVDSSIDEEKELLDELRSIGEVNLESNLSIVSLIGNNINHTPGLAQTIFNGLQQDDTELVNVRMICLGASKHNFCFLVNSDQADLAIKRLHQTFIEEK